MSGEEQVGAFHACVACVTGHYADDRHICTSFCGVDLNDRTIRAVQGPTEMKRCNCAPCLVAFDAWSATKTEAEIHWESL